MSVRLSKKNIDIKKIYYDCGIVGISAIGFPPMINAYGETMHNIYVPFSYFKKEYSERPNSALEYVKTNFIFHTEQYPFRTDGGRKQDYVYNEALKRIKKYGSVLLSLFCGYGKTYLAIRLAFQLKLKTAILAHRTILIDQWYDSIIKFTNAKVQRVDTNGILDDSADFYIFNITFVPKYWDKEVKMWRNKNLGRYKDIGCLIVDEAHIACAEEMSKALLFFNPKVCIALTATPEREDGLDEVLKLYFGDYKKTQIVEICNNPFIVYSFFTNIKPPIVYNKAGKKDWGSIVDFLAEDKDRNKMILDIVLKFEKNTILVLTKRIKHCNLLDEMMRKKGIITSVMTGTQQTYDKASRVLISTFSKLGVGFHDKRLDMLIIASSVKNIEQYAGRLRDGVNKKRIIIDMIDFDYNCIAHWKKRKAWYLSRKGIIRTYRKMATDEPQMKRLAKVKI